MNEQVFKIVIALIPVIGAVITTIVGLIGKKYVDKQNFQRAKDWAKIFVATIDLEKFTGSQKKAQVIELLKRQKTGLSEKQLETLVEAVFLEFDKAGIVNTHKKIEPSAVVSNIV